MSNGLQDIRNRSYMIWVRQGRPHGHDLEHWLQAERELAEEAMVPARLDTPDMPKKAPAARKRRPPTAKPVLAN
jgi:hypothetical protein